MTTDRDEIRKWVEDRGGRPASVAAGRDVPVARAHGLVAKDTGRGGDPGILYIDFPGRGDDDALQEISWDEFFEAFDENDLAFLYQETTADGSESRFNKFVKR